ncbi:MAG TPA: SpoIIE family protein phosphatase, partial [Herpetosiphonaceae bacterium]
ASRQQRRRQGAAEWLEVGGFPLGVRLAGLGAYAEARRALAAGDTLVLSSDGLVEATNAAGELFGFDRVRDAPEQAPAAGAQDILDHLLRSVTDFLAGAAPHDDLTIVIVHRAAEPPPS